MSNCNTQTPPDPNRRENARNKRIQAADIAYNRAHPCHQNNCEEIDYPYVGNFSKGLQHDSLGDVLPASYQSMLYALQTRVPADFENIQLGPGGKKLTNPQAGLAFDLQGADPQSVTLPPAPRIDSAEVSSEMGELYWMALSRDVHFNDYSWNATVQQAIQSLNTEFSYYQPRTVYGSISGQTVFRGVYPGEAVGPYLSQFLLKGNSDPGSQPGQGRYDSDGFIRYGALKIDQRRQTVQPGIDYLTDFYWWLQVQDGMDKRGMDVIDPTRRFIRNLRDLGNFVHFDNVADAFYNAAWYLLQEPTGDQQTSSARPDIDREFPFDQMNPYNGYVKQAPLVTYGDIHGLRLVWETVTRALQAVWFQKWFVHRRLRPEELGGRIDNHLTGRRSYPQINGEILGSLTGGLLHGYFPARWGSYLLPQAFPEGAPTHPAYGAGHATAAGALATILKAFFNEDTPIENPMVASPDGLSLMPYTGADAGSMTVGGELNKLAGNIAIGRNSAGVHWNSDYRLSLLLGEEIAIRILQEQSILYNEGGGFMLTRFDGTCIKIWDGHVDYCWGGSIEPNTTAPYGEECPTTSQVGEESTYDYAGEESTYDYAGEETTYDLVGEETTYDYGGEESTYPYEYPTASADSSPDQQAQMRPPPEY